MLEGPGYGHMNDFCRPHPSLARTAEASSGRCGLSPFSFSWLDLVEQSGGWTPQATAYSSVPDASASVLCVCLVRGRSQESRPGGRAGHTWSLADACQPDQAVTCTYSPHVAQGQGQHEKFPAKIACFP